jgi:hypothetical protein
LNIRKEPFTVLLESSRAANQFEIAAPSALVVLTNITVVLLWVALLKANTPVPGSASVVEVENA